MKRFTQVAGILVVAVAAVHFGIQQAEAAAAIVVHDGNCSVPGVGAAGNLGGAPGGIASGTGFQLVENDNKVTLTCHTTVTNLSGKGQTFKGISCGIVIPSGGFVVTTDTHLTVSKSGKAVLRCNYTKP